ncbi:DUF721 domain-containing protein [bacterium]|nr:DUF721 domain-containing protein [bacterium]
METLGHVLKSTLKELGIESSLRRYQTLEVWSGVVGPKISEIAEPQALRGGKLIVRVKNDVWRHELLYHLPDIIIQLNRKVGMQAVEEIILI